MAGRGREPRRHVLVAFLVATVALATAACGTGGGHPSGAAPSTTATGAAGPLVPPKTSVVQDGQFLSDVTLADPALATYERTRGNVALRALLTDGTAFCALLRRGGGVDQALVDVAVGARAGESQTHLPLSVTTFNSVEAVALLTLCPSEQRLLPATDRSRIRALGAGLAGRAG